MQSLPTSTHCYFRNDSNNVVDPAQAIMACTANDDKNLLIIYLGTSWGYRVLRAVGIDGYELQYTATTMAISRLFTVYPAAKHKVTDGDKS
jgi:hypothetical protein